MPVICLTSAAAARIATVSPKFQTEFQFPGPACDMILSAIVSLVAAAAVHHAPALSRLDAANIGVAAVVCARLIAAVSICFSVKSVWRSCGASADGGVWGAKAIWFTAAVACGCHLMLALLHSLASASVGTTSELALLPARVLLLQFVCSVLVCTVRSSRDSLCVALSSALYLASAVSGCVAVYAAVAVLLASTFKLHSMCRSSSTLSTVSKASSFGSGCHAWTLAVICWYGTNHAPQFSSLKVSSGFAFVSSFNWHICGASLFFETFAPVFVWAMYDLPFFSLLLLLLLLLLLTPFSSKLLHANAHTPGSLCLVTDSSQLRRSDVGERKKRASRAWRSLFRRWRWQVPLWLLLCTLPKFILLQFVPWCLQAFRDVTSWSGAFSRQNLCSPCRWLGLQ